MKLRHVGRFVLLWLLTGPTSAGVEQVSIGVLAYRGEERALLRWAPTAAYLTDTIAGHRFVIRPLDLEGMRGATARGELDFILTNPGHYVYLESRYHCTRLVTVRNRHAGQSYTHYGAAIFTRAGRPDITRLADLKGRSFMAVSERAFGGFQMAWRELNQHGVDPHRDLQVHFGGFPQDEIVYAVRAGKVDAGTVRADVLERMASEGRIELTDILILNPQRSEQFPAVYSSSLYPEWPFAKAAATSDALAQRVAVALLTMPAEHPAAAAGGYGGWTVPLDYQPVHELLQALHIAPYEDLGRTDLAELVRQYYHWLIAFAILLAVMAYITGHVLELNRRLKQSKRRLEEEMRRRQQARATLHQSASALRALHSITSAQDLEFEGQVQALLTLGCERFGLPIGALASTADGQYTIEEVVSPDHAMTRGSVLPLAETYCSEALPSDEPLHIEHAGQSSWRTHPAYQRSGLEAYLGVRLVVEGRVYGTLSFSGRQPRHRAFTNTDRQILKLMAQWVGSALQRQQAKAEMDKLSRALEQTADMVMITDRQGAIEYVNPAFEHATGFTRSEVFGRSPSVLRSGHHDSGFYAEMWQTILNGKVFRSTFVNRCKDDSLLYEEKTITPLKDAQGDVTHFIATGKDITERTQAEEQARKHRAALAHVARVSTMGEMATGIAHELNQPLSAIANYVHGCMRRLEDKGCGREELATVLAHIAGQSERAAEIIKRLRNFVRKGEPRRSRASVAAIIGEVLSFVEHEARQKDIRLQVTTEEDLPPIVADDIQIEQVLLNLVRNAMQAMDVPDCVRRDLRIQSWASAADRITVAVTDTGPGLGDEMREHAFDAFFTTKAHGLGMGLSISRSIIEAHGGSLSISPDVGGGTTFQFSLPISPDQRRLAP